MLVVDVVVMGRRSPGEGQAGRRRISSESGKAQKQIRILSIGRAGVLFVGFIVYQSSYRLRSARDLLKPEVCSRECFSGAYKLSQLLPPVAWTALIDVLRLSKAHEGFRLFAYAVPG